MTSPDMILLTVTSLSQVSAARLLRCLPFPQLLHDQLCTQLDQRADRVLTSGEPVVQQIILGGFAWAMGNVDADVTPNIGEATPDANQLPA